MARELLKRPSGLASKELAASAGCTLDTASQAITALVTRGEAFRASLGHRTVRYFRTLKESENYLDKHKPPLKQKTKPAPFKHDKAEAIIPKGLKITKCPGFTGDRFEVKGPIFGGFMDEWKTLRGVRD
jgi:hypothetical protein